MIPVIVERDMRNHASLDDVPASTTLTVSNSAGYAAAGLPGSYQPGTILFTRFSASLWWAQWFCGSSNRNEVMVRRNSSEWVTPN